MPLGSAFRFFEGDNVMTTIEERVLALVEAAYREGWDDGCSYINTEDNGWANLSARQALAPFTKGPNDVR